MLIIPLPIQSEPSTFRCVIMRLSDHIKYDRCIETNVTKEHDRVKQTVIQLNCALDKPLQVIITERYFQRFSTP